MRIRNIIRDYFTFSRNERIGLYVLIGLISILIVANKLIFYFEKPVVADREEFDRYVKLLKDNNNAGDNFTEQGLFNFDPNSIDSTALDSLLMPVQIKRNLISYRNKGGKFRFKEDLAKIYGMNDSIYACIENFIQLKSKPKAKPKTSVKKVSPQVDISAKDLIANMKREDVRRKIELNTATESELKSIRGIGDVLSSRIIKYRNLLGGYYYIEQLKEVYGLSEETYNKVSPFFTVDPNFIKTINVNFVGKRELIKHPYIGWKEINAIQKYKSKVGFIGSISQLRDENVVNDSIYQQVCPYLRTKND